MHRRRSSTRKTSSTRSSESSTSRTPSPRTTFKRARLCQSDASSSGTPSPSSHKHLRTLPDVPRWMHDKIVHALPRLTTFERAEMLATLHISLDWTRASALAGWVNLEGVKLPGHVVRRLWTRVILPRAEQSTESSSDTWVDHPYVPSRDTQDDDHILRKELPSLIPWLSLDSLLPIVQLVESHLPQLAALRETANEEYELDVDAWPEELVRRVWDLVEPVVRERLRGEYAALLFAELEAEGSTSSIKIHNYTEPGSPQAGQAGQGQITFDCYEHYDISFSLDKDIIPTRHIHNVFPAHYDLYLDDNGCAHTGGLGAWMEVNWILL
ncbi:hypothetical protein DACRYDRAFT_119208 [Dacryopinax primogenitus]|uniref:Uncharacterized protein n=1 Tax=Dacryopinax primogenitus (strain DJM 731) TaxID=1858805 RepID=M5FVX2_DACPD|nr:uncharacterized protein DACRYDRAFT_119208 [Dacryopinax primogenitus]EJT97511.1 hypothetical protein DACRYDRAFT_119208 [Dacryopinax primogenitus]